MLISFKPTGLKGFTIVELLIVIVVVGILASVTVAAFSTVKGRANDTRRIQDLKTIVKGLELYKEMNGSYPMAVGSPNADGWELSNTGTGTNNFLSALVTSKALSAVPLDPKNSATGFVDPNWSTPNNVYFYYRYGAGAGGCDATRGEFYVLGVTRMDTVAQGTSHPTSPGWPCTDISWNYRGAWVTGGYTK